MNLSQNVQRNGLLGGLASVILLLVLYFLDPKLLFDQVWAGLPFIVIFPLFMTLAAIADKQDNGGFLAFPDAFKSAFFTGLLGLFLMVAFNYILQVVIDPSLIELSKEKGIEAAIKIAEAFSGGEGLSDDEVDEIVKRFEEQGAPTLGNTFISFLFSGILGAIPAVIIAAFVRKKEDPLAKIQNNTLDSDQMA